MSTRNPPRYRSYVLRCWEERRRAAEDGSIWRFMLEDTRTGERHGFATFDGLMAALHRQITLPDDLIGNGLETEGG